MEELWDEMSRLPSIREDEREIGRISSVMEQLEVPWTPTAVKMKAVSTSSLINSHKKLYTRMLIVLNLW